MSSDTNVKLSPDHSTFIFTCDAKHVIPQPDALTYGHSFKKRDTKLPSEELLLTMNIGLGCSFSPAASSQVFTPEQRALMQDCLEKNPEIKRLLTQLPQMVVKNSEVQERAIAGDRQAQFELGKALENTGSPKRALEWYQKAAGQNHIESLFCLAEIYSDKEKQDLLKAVEYLSQIIVSAPERAFSYDRLHEGCIEALTMLRDIRSQLSGEQLTLLSDTAKQGFTYLDICDRFPRYDHVPIVFASGLSRQDGPSRAETMHRHGCELHNAGLTSRAVECLMFEAKLENDKAMRQLLAIYQHDLLTLANKAVQASIFPLAVRASCIALKAERAENDRNANNPEYEKKTAAAALLDSLANRQYDNDPNLLIPLSEEFINAGFKSKAQALANQHYHLRPLDPC